MEKNYFAALDYRTPLAFVTGPVFLMLWSVSVLGLFSGTYMGLAAGGALMATIIPALWLSRILRWKSGPALLTPFVFVALFYAITRSTYVTLWRGGVKWRDTFYPLDKLRAGNVY